MELRPNILYIMADQLNANCLSVMGSQVKTPNIDQLAAEGGLFRNAYCNFPVCGPSRCSFITGQYPRTHGILDNNAYDAEPEHNETIPIRFRQYGYQTAMIGKAHMMKKWDDKGFEHIRYSDLTDGDWRDPLKNHYFKYLHDLDLADEYDLNDKADKRGFVSNIPQKHSLEAWTGDQALEFLGNRDMRRPFFMQLSFQRPHGPFTIPYDEKLLYDPAKLDLPESAVDLFENRFASKPKQMKNMLDRIGGSPYIPEDKEDLKLMLAHYFSLITWIDEQVGRVISHLKHSGEYENTIIVFTSDHGDYAGEHGMMLKGAGMYESLHRIPFILKYPGMKSGQQFHELIESVDLFPTLCALADVPVPQTVEGQDIIPIVEQGETGKKHVICERGGSRQLAIRTLDYRMIYNGNQQEGELYDVKNDPDELHNVYEKKGFFNIRMELLEIMFDYLKRHRTFSPSLTGENPSHAHRNSMTRLVHKHQVNWNDIKGMYKA